MVGDKLPLEIHAPMLVVSDKQPKFLDAVVGIMGGTLSFKQLDTGVFIIGGGIRGLADAVTNKVDLSPLGLAEFVQSALHVFPGLGEVGVIRAWGGIEGYTPDHLPIIGEGRQAGIIHGFGFSAHGFQLGPAVGEAIADVIIGQQTRVDLSPFSPKRFDKQKNLKI